MYFTRQFLAILTLALYVNGAKLFINGNANFALKGDVPREGDVGKADANGFLKPSTTQGISTNIDRKGLPSPDKNVWSINDSKFTAATGFRILRDGSDVPGGRASRGHRSIALAVAKKPADVIRELNALGWTKEPNETKPKKPVTKPAAPKPAVPRPASPSKPKKIGKPRSNDQTESREHARDFGRRAWSSRRS